MSGQAKEAALRQAGDALAAALINASGFITDERTRRQMFAALKRVAPPIHLRGLRPRPSPGCW